MAEQPHPWGDRTLEVTPQDPWANSPAPAAPTSGAAWGAAPVSGAPVPSAGTPGGHPGPGQEPGHSFSRGVAHVKPASPRTEPFTAAHEPTGTGWPGEEAAPQQRQPLSWHVQQLRRGAEWSGAAALFAFVCWGIWAISSGGDDLLTPVLVFVTSLLVAVGLFALARLVGRVVLERQLGRVRRTARGAHLVAAVFLVGVGIAHLRQVEWVMTAWNWVTGLGG